MPTPPTTPVFLDLAALSLYIFFAFFTFLVFWLHREGKREGYPLVSDRSDRPNFGTIHGFPETPKPKVFLLHYPHGATVTQGQNPERDVTGLIVENAYNGSPFDPKGDPMKDGIGAASYAMRADTPDLAFDDNLPKIVPLRAAPGWTIPEEDPDPRGKSVTTLDGEVAGTVVDLWVDRSEILLRYIEVEVPGGRRVLVPMFLATVNDEGEVRVKAVTAAQLAAAPGIKSPEQVTLLEEDMVSGYFGGGHLHATPERSEPLL
ncbi:PRC-barrel domain-containing protein [Roseomonas sp. PWR1]|uniref:PRC-barrel domain-containing protein n=1 Tax=Roseomonas nitratireducens TaxID=2820810 RepID=A0ABS4APQ3_9PROT|nr:photosynthetic reaction center subunit H [Neoroseomonas nitratireducens]MBP0463335.1 PRC-barrel domain-containing protein [Neoroseomonas nitratireducens]